MKKTTLFMILAACVTAASAQRNVTTLRHGWQFSRDGGKTVTVSVPHDAAISGPFDRSIDLQKVAVEQNGEKAETWKTGRTGGLPFIGKFTYTTDIEIADTAGRSFTLEIDGAMSNPAVYVNGSLAGTWGSGYNSFYLSIDSLITPGTNTLRIVTENPEKSSRWYPGAGLYRHVRLVETDRVHIPTWGTHVTTPYVDADMASVKIATSIAGAADRDKIEIVTTIYDPEGQAVARDSVTHVNHGRPAEQNFLITAPRLWDTDSPALYTARTELWREGRMTDSYDTRFGVRRIDFLPEKGFFLNGKPVKFRGVCNHHDLGPLGAAVNRSALRHQLTLLKGMGVNAIRTSHNMPAPELVELCDEMGLMLMVEAFDDWSYRPKSENGYGKIFDRWAERDITNMVTHYRNNPSVVMWSTGNEVPSQWDKKNGAKMSGRLLDLVHSLDGTRPVTNGMDQIKGALTTGFAEVLDVPGFNYKPGHYDDAYRRLPQKMILGSETASTVSSRGVYKFPVELKKMATYADNQSSSYDTEACSWSNIPDIDFAADDDKEFVMGQFVWTGFDYLGEPTPYDTDAWPSHSSYFGIIDLASLPKDRYYLYRSKWNERDTTLHVLPHWEWSEREGEVTPVFVYTSLPKAELFVNGRSMGVREKNDSTVMHRYRLMWNDVVYTPGEIKVVAMDAEGNPVAEARRVTPGKAERLVLTPSRTEIDANGDELVYLTVMIEDEDGNPLSRDDREVKFEVTGAGSFEATANGDATCLMPFGEPRMKLFSGAATVIARGGTAPGEMTVKATARGVKPAVAKIMVK
ncbi:MAG: DUF4982 domain-containing protein [Duncaniella sp.]|nr:DUF4982 domain-containing protein [Duncaniella sp.]